MEAYQERVAEEREQLVVRVDKLRIFIAGDHFQTLSDPEQTLLRRQYAAMQDYLGVLNERLLAWAG